MSVANPLWGAARIRGELLKLGIDLGQTTVAKYMAKRKAATVAGLEDVPSQSCRCIASMDLFVVPTISFLLWTCDFAAFASRACVAGRDLTSGRGMDCPAASTTFRCFRRTAPSASAAEGCRAGIDDKLDLYLLDRAQLYRGQTRVT